MTEWSLSTWRLGAAVRRHCPWWRGVCWGPAGRVVQL